MTKTLRDTVLQLAKQSALRLTGKEVDKLTGELKDFESSLAAMKQLDTDKVLPTSRMTSRINVWRTDKANSSPIDPEDLVAYAAENDGQSIKVPKVL